MSPLPPFHRGFLGELSTVVQASPLVQDHLGPALLHTYTAVHVVEGLDVDKEDFDKYATRYVGIVQTDPDWCSCPGNLVVIVLVWKTNGRII